MEHSEAYISFKNKMMHFQDDIEIIDMFYALIKRDSWENKEKLFDMFDREKHKSISRYKICDTNRRIVVTHLRATMYAAYVKELYEELTIYLKSIILESYKNATNTPERIVGNHSFNMPATEILKSVRDGNIEKTVIDNIFQSLEKERSTRSLIEKACKKLGIEIEKELISSAVSYLDIRHKLVHADGYADESFRKEHPNIEYTNRSYIKLTYRILSDMRQTIFDLVEAIDGDGLRKKLLKDHSKR